MLVAATFFMVSGGPYGLEALVQKTGVGPALALLLATPLLWSLPTALMLGELAAAASLGLAFERLVLLDVILHGASLLLEFAALVALRLREPALPRPFRVPGGLAGAALVGVGPALLIGLAFVRNRDQAIGRMSAWTLGALLMAAGPPRYALAVRRR